MAEQKWYFNPNTPMQAPQLVTVISNPWAAGWSEVDEAGQAVGRLLVDRYVFDSPTEAIEAAIADYQGEQLRIQQRIASLRGLLASGDAPSLGGERSPE